MNARHAALNRARFQERDRRSSQREAAAAAAAAAMDNDAWAASADAVPDNELPDVLPVQELARQVMADRALAHPAAAASERPVYWAGLGADATAALPALPQRKQRIDTLDWRTFLNLRRPDLWFPLARLLRRRIVVHAGPTNSGKTHRALTRLAEADSGLYCGPLRLLAWEIHDRLTARGVKASLLTGQEVIDVPGATHVSSTVEMTLFDRAVDVAVIDEGQMMADTDRGFAWTNAFLGVAAKEVHVCGDASTLQWVLEAAKLTGEEVHVNQYQRLTPLAVEEAPLRSLADLRPGDAVIVFRRDLVYEMRDRIQRETGRRCAIVYGSLPPAVRKLQAELFNDPTSGVDILVATDAVGMGLNLNIGRVVFSSTVKFDGEEFRRLSTSETLQIGGRAGRFGSLYGGGGGTVTALYHQEDVDFLAQQFALKPPVMEQAQLAPSTGHLLAFCRRFPSLPLSSYLHNLRARHSVDPRYALGSLDSLLELAEIIDPVAGLEPYHRVTLCYAPAAVDKYPAQRVLLEWYARQLASGAPVPIPATTYVTRPGVPADPAGIEKLEETFSNLDLYVWLAHRFGPTAMPHSDAARRDRDLIAELIHAALEAHGGRARAKHGASAAPIAAKPPQQQLSAEALAEREATAASVTAHALGLIGTPPATASASSVSAADAAADAEPVARVRRATVIEDSCDSAATAAAAAAAAAKSAARAALPGSETLSRRAPAAIAGALPPSDELDALSADDILAALFAPRAQPTESAAVPAAVARAGVWAAGDVDCHSVGAAEAAPLANPLALAAAAAEADAAAASGAVFFTDTPAPAPAPESEADATAAAAHAGIDVAALGLSGSRSLHGLAASDGPAIRNKPRFR
jgi:ATP-dependent RNA helicase SUPV3L1/SUV3